MLLNSLFSFVFDHTRSPSPSFLPLKNTSLFSKKNPCFFFSSMKNSLAPFLSELLEKSWVYHIILAYSPSFHSELLTHFQYVIHQYPTSFYQQIDFLPRRLYCQEVLAQQFFWRRFLLLHGGNSSPRSNSIPVLLWKFPNIDMKVDGIEIGPCSFRQNTPDYSFFLAKNIFSPLFFTVGEKILFPFSSGLPQILLIFCPVLDRLGLVRVA